MSHVVLDSMRQRVQCARPECGAHRDLTIAPRCMVCGHFGYLAVEPTAGDLDGVTLELVACAELLDVAFHERVVLGSGHPLVRRLAAACRARALMLVGVSAAHGKELGHRQFLGCAEALRDSDSVID